VRIVIYEPGGAIIATVNTEAIGECSVRVELEDRNEIRAGIVGRVLVREVDGKLLYSAENAFADEERVHVLWGAASLCKMPGIPGSWPAGHRWVTLDDEKSHGLATCASCKQRLADLYPRLQALGGTTRRPG